MLTYMNNKRRVEQKNNMNSIIKATLGIQFCEVVVVNSIFLIRLAPQIDVIYTNVYDS